MNPHLGKSVCLPKFSIVREATFCW